MHHFVLWQVPDMAIRKIVKKVVKPKVVAKPERHPPIPNKPAPKKPKPVNEKDAFIWVEGQQESGGNYRARNASSGALG